MTLRARVLLALVASVLACHSAQPASQARSDGAGVTTERRAATGPDTEPFQAIGYLIPDSAYQLGDYDLANIDLALQFIELQRGGPDSTTRYDCPGATITRDTLDLSCPDTPLGTVLVQGKLVDDAGHVIGQSAQFAWATVSVLKGKGVVLSRRMRFTFTLGD